TEGSITHQSLRRTNRGYFFALRAAVRNLSMAILSFLDTSATPFWLYFGFFPSAMPVVMVLGFRSRSAYFAAINRASAPEYPFIPIHLKNANAEYPRIETR